MAISYSKVNWDTSKYVNPTNMNQMDNGIKAACDGVDTINGGTITGGTIALTSDLSNYLPKSASYTQPLTGDLWLQGTGNRTLVIGTQSAGATGYIQLSNNNHYGLMYPLNLTGDRQYRLPDNTGTLALTSDIQNGSTSDRNAKTEISELNPGKSAEFIYSLKPCEYKFKDGTSGRKHHGLIAQEVKESMGADDWGVYVDKNAKADSDEDKIENPLALRYSEFVADLIATVQSQNERIIVLENNIKELKEVIQNETLK